MSCSYATHLTGTCIKHCKCEKCHQAMHAINLTEEVTQQMHCARLNNTGYNTKSTLVCSAVRYIGCPICPHQHMIEKRYGWTVYDGGCLATYIDGEHTGYCYM